MTFQDDPNLKRKLQELESEVQRPSQSTPFGTESESSFDGTQAALKQLQPVFERFKLWFNDLPPAGKILGLVIIGGIVLSLLNTVFKLVSSLIALALLSGVVFVLYKVFIAPKSDS
ncbi:hypothetical protein K4A83_22165 [Spirulina subsalsa FACHB-351]|uniref:Uncharacterized protein n=1 Tax=Spirulina subsalsa FACHB-351 TaxID=234711 RepID=A0ABT3LBR7_9CYAN|nr:hypothetical protein [Spirulina subsalsa]MCW6038936.1 hypothetical protein [Spirulina subsalsa FACHB-351]